MRFGIRSLVKRRLRDEHADDPAAAAERYHRFWQTLQRAPLAIETDKANEQHYEVDARFYQHALGQHKKYSCCYFADGDDLDAAEARMLSLTMQRAQLSDGQDILELGCGWGSLTLAMAQKYPQASITAVSNSNSQRLHILAEAQRLGLNNVHVITCDINAFEPAQVFDRVVSVEMFEHVRNYETLFSNIRHWLKNDGLLFIHVFCHRHLMYPFEDQGDDDWMARYFFSGGQMPAADTFLHFQKHLNIQRRWLIGGEHYQKTANAWLQNMDNNKAAILQLFKQLYGEDAGLWVQRWRVFFMACAELFGYRGGREWMVGHYLFKPND